MDNEPVVTFEKIETYFSKHKGVVIRSARQINESKFFLQTAKLNFYTHLRYDSDRNIIDSWETTA